MQKAVTTAVCPGARHGDVPTIVNVLSADPDRQLLLGHYFSLRRDSVPIAKQLTAPACNVFIQAASLPIAATSRISAGPPTSGSSAPRTI